MTGPHAPRRCAPGEANPRHPLGRSALGSRTLPLGIVTIVAIALGLSACRRDDGPPEIPCSIDRDCYPYRCDEYDGVCKMECDYDGECWTDFRCIDGYCGPAFLPPTVARECTDAPASVPPSDDHDFWGTYPTSRRTLTTLLDRECNDHGDCLYQGRARVAPAHFCQDRRCTPSAEIRHRCTLGIGAPCASSAHDSRDAVCDLDSLTCLARCEATHGCPGRGNCGPLDCGGTRVGACLPECDGDCDGECLEFLDDHAACLPPGPAQLDEPCSAAPIAWVDSPELQCGEGMYCISGGCALRCATDWNCEPDGTCVEGDRGPFGSSGMCTWPCDPLAPECDDERVCVHDRGEWICKRPEARYLLEGETCVGDADSCEPGTWCSPHTKRCSTLCGDDEACGEGDLCVPLSADAGALGMCEHECGIDTDCDDGLGCIEVETVEASVCGSDTGTDPDLLSCDPERPICPPSARECENTVDGYACVAACDPLGEPTCSEDTVCTATPFGTLAGHCDPHPTEGALGDPCATWGHACSEHGTICWPLDLGSESHCLKVCGDDLNCAEGERCERWATDFGVCVATE